MDTTPHHTASTRHPARLPRHTAHLAVVLTTLALAATGCGGHGSSSAAGGRSEQSFCADLHAGNDQMKANYTSASQDLGSQWSMIFANVGAFTTMIHKLDDDAPAAIQTQMHDTRQAWDSQAANTPDNLSASGIGAALVKSLMTSMMASQSMKDVDTYAQQNCDMQIFGTDTAAAGLLGSASASPADNTWSCQDFDSIYGYSMVDPSATYKDLTDTLTQMSSSASAPQTATAAATLLSDVESLSPTPATSLEALGQLESDGSSDVSDLYDAISADCPDQAQYANTDAQQAAALQTVLDGDVLQHADTLNGACQGGAEVLGFPDANALVGSCDDNQHTGYALLDLTTGQITWFTQHDAGGQLDVDQSGYPVTASGTVVAWTTLTRHKASGLSPETWSADLDLHDLATGQDTTVALVTNGRGGGPGENSSFVVGADALGFYIEVPRSGLTGTSPAAGQLRQYSRTGKLMWQLDNNPDGYDIGDLLKPETPDTGFVTDNNEHDDGLIDLRTGKTLARGDQDMNYLDPVDSCDLHANITTFWGGTWVSDTADGLVTTKLPVKEYGLEPTDTGVVVDGSNGLTAMRPNGSTLWHIGANIVQSSTAFGKWIIVTNTSGRKVLVGAASGKEPVGVNAEVKSTVLHTTENDSVVLTDDGQTAWVETESGDQSTWTRLPATGVCGTAGPNLAQ